MMLADETARLEVQTRQDGRALVLTGRLDADGAGQIWLAAIEAAGQDSGGQPLTIDIGGVDFCDMAGASLLAELQRAHAGEAVITGQTERIEGLIARAVAAHAEPAPPEPTPPWTFGGMARAGLSSAANGTAFLGEAILAFVRLPSRRRMLRVPDLLRYADQAGFRSLPLVILLGFLIGLILAFQSAIPMRRFGADLYVANLVSISLLRELGPLLAAVILAGRTGSAFAAEIGTMKVNEEIDALVTMGLDPMTMLVLPRLLAAMFVMPAMTLVLNIAGLLGMGVVMMAFGYTPEAIIHQVSYAVRTGDLIQGLIKAVCFGVVIAAIGCREGLGTGVGPRAVGLSATGAVVGGIVSTILLDGLFAVLLFRLHL